MSNHLAIATVTAGLRQIIRSAVEATVSGAGVTMLRPDATGAGIPTTRVNLFLYQVSPNPDWRNADLPGRRQDGTLAQRPVAALDLHYLFTFFGDDAQLEPQRLMATTVRSLHSQPILTRETIRLAIAAGPGTFLNGSDLADQTELVRCTPSVLSLEDLSKLWSVFFQTPYSLSMTYQCSVVLIDSELVAQSALPVRVANIAAIPFRRPLIDAVISESGPLAPIFSDTTILIRGKQLGGEGVAVRIADTNTPPTAVDDSEVQLDLSTVPAASLRAGVQAVQLIYPVVMSPETTLATGVESDVAAFILRPRITNVAVADVDGADDELRSATLTVTVEPEIGKQQKVVLLLNEFDAPTDRAPFAYTFTLPSLDVPAAPDSSPTVDVPVSGVVAGTYLVRIRVDGAESIPGTDADGLYNSPTGTIP